MESPAFDTLFKNYRCLAFFGICKNAGKTTALNFLIERLSKSYTLGITGIGRDGESTDVVTGTHKPPIFLPKNSLAATVSGLLSSSSTTKEILKSSGVYSQLGEIIIVRAKEGGFIEIAGPSISTDLISIKNSLFSFGADKVLIDGAINRKSFANLKIADGAILCSGASFDKNMDVVIKETAHIVKLFSLPKAKIETDFYCTTALDGDNKIIETEETTLQGLFSNKTIRSVFVCGALTDNKLLPLIRSNVDIKDKALIVTDATKILLNPTTFDIFNRKGGRLEVIGPFPIVAVTVNPTSAYGWKFDSLEFKKRMSAEIDLPIYDLKD